MQQVEDPKRLRRPLQLLPLRGLRYEPSRVGDLSAVTSPPYDVIGPEGLAHYEQASPYNVARLILPRAEPGQASRYEHGARDLRDWLRDGVLREDDAPALYVYEQSRDGRRWRGLVGAMSLHDPEEAVVLPHEEVFEGPVQDRTALMRSTGAQLEPILLTHAGAPRLAAEIDRLTVGAPDVQLSTEDGITHRIWAIRDPGFFDLVALELGDRQVLIADGHHRYAAYLRLRTGDPSWSLGLAMLVDADHDALDLAPIHRSLLGGDLAQVTAALTPYARLQVLKGTLEDLALRVSASADVAFLLTDSARSVLVDGFDEEWLDAVLPREHSDCWRNLDATVLHAAVLEQLLLIPESDPRIGYHHDLASVRAQLLRHGGVAVLMRPARLVDVATLAARGERMPRKSTSFGPKPRGGLVMRLVEAAGGITRPA